MVDVGVRQKHKINLVGVDGELLILKDVFALFHAAVDETILAAALQKGATASHFVGLRPRMSSSWGASSPFLKLIITWPGGFVDSDCSCIWVTGCGKMKRNVMSVCFRTEVTS